MDSHSCIIAFNISAQTVHRIALNEFDIHMPNDQFIYWIHADLSHPSDFDMVAKKLNLTDELKDLCNQNDVVPKLFDTTQALTLRIQVLLDNTININEINSENLLIHLTPRYCLTASFHDLPPIRAFKEGYSKSMQYAKTPCFILFLILDAVINDYSTQLYELELIAENIDLTIREEHQLAFQQVMEVKNHVIKIKRLSIAMRDILMRISGRQLAMISEACRLSLVNLLNHSQMIVNEADSIREILNGTLDQIDNTLMQNMNQSIRVLTAFASIFLPVTLIPCIYGMNFHWIPEYEWKYGYFYALLLMLACGLGLWGIFRKLKLF